MRNCLVIFQVGTQQRSWDHFIEAKKLMPALGPVTHVLIQHGGGYEATSQALSVHRSTLKYRLQRIRELTGLDLGDPETRFNLELATRAWVTLQALRG